MSELLEDLSDVDCLPSRNVECPEFASAVDDMPFLMIWAMVRMAPLFMAGALCRWRERSELQRGCEPSVR